MTVPAALRIETEEPALEIKNDSDLGKLLAELEKARAGAEANRRRALEDLEAQLRACGQ